MPDESDYYRKGEERGLDGENSPLGVFDFPFDSSNRRKRDAAQRGWESGRNAKLYKPSDTSTSDISTTEHTSNDVYEFILEKAWFAITTAGSLILGGAVALAVIKERFPLRAGETVGEVIFFAFVCGALGFVAGIFLIGSIAFFFTRALAIVVAFFDWLSKLLK